MFKHLLSLPRFSPILATNQTLCKLAEIAAFSREFS